MSKNRKSSRLKYLIFTLMMAICLFVPVSTMWLYANAQEPIRRDRISSEEIASVPNTSESVLAVTLNQLVSDGVGQSPPFPQTVPPRRALSAHQSALNNGAIPPPPLKAQHEFTTSPIANQPPGFGTPAYQSTTVASSLSSNHVYRNLIVSIASAKDEEAKQEAIDEARSFLEDHYDKYIDAYEEKVSVMEARVSKLREQLEKRKDAKKRLVSSKLELITSEADGFGWPEGDPNMSWRPSFAPGNNGINIAPRYEDSVFSDNSLYERKKMSSRPGNAIESTRANQNSQNFNYPPNTRPTISAPKSVDSTSSAAVPFTAPAPSLSPYATRGWRAHVSFTGYFRVARQMLEQEKYGKFLDTYMVPTEFREEIREKSLDQLANEFSKEEVQWLIDLLMAAEKKSPQHVSETDSELDFKLRVDGKRQTLTLVRDGTVINKQSWYIKSLRNLRPIPTERADELSEEEASDSADELLK